MLDILGAILLIAGAFVTWQILIRIASPDAGVRRKIATRVALWFAAVVALGALGAFAVPGLGTPLIGAAVLLPIVAGILMARRTPAIHYRLMNLPIAALIALNVGRAIGVFFLVLQSAGRLPSTFAHSAGWGDIAVAVLAVPVALAAQRRIAGWQALVLAWNTLGFADLITAVTLGVGSSDSPLRFIAESPASTAVATMPWVLIPAFLVPTFLLIHLVVFAQLRKSWVASAAPRPARASARRSSAPSHGVE